jgi:hypothetical protein
MGFTAAYSKIPAPLLTLELMVYSPLAALAAADQLLTPAGILE